MALELLSTQCGTPGGMILANDQWDSPTCEKHLQHVTFLEVYCLKTEAIDVVAIIDVVGVPIGPQGVDGGQALLVSQSCRDNPILASLQHHYDRRETIRVHMKGADCPFPSN